MANALSIFDPNAKLPAHIAAFLGDKENSNIAPKVTVPHLGIEGKVWSLNIDGNKTKMVKKDAEGEEVPVSVMRVVILDYAKRRGRAYYEGGYDPTKPGKPLCWSEDGIRADASVVEPPCENWTGKCEGCPLSVKGSKVNEQGKAVVACSSHRMLAVVPAGDLDFQPMRLKLAITSDWDNQSPELAKAGWFAFSNYMDMLTARGITHSGIIVTKMKFDPNVAYPKVIFSPDRWLDDEELVKVNKLWKDEAVQKLLKQSFTPAGDPIEKPKAVAAPPIAPAPVKKAAAPVDDEDDTPPPPKAAKKAAAPVDDDDDDAPFVAPKATKKAAPVDDDEDETPKPKAQKVKAEPKAKASTSVPSGLSDLLSEWGE